MPDSGSYLALGGVSVLIQVNGTTYPGIIPQGRHPRHDGSRASPELTWSWCGTASALWASCPPRERSDTEALRFGSESEQDFAVLMPVRGRYRFREKIVENTAV